MVPSKHLRAMGDFHVAHQLRMMKAATDPRVRHPRVQADGDEAIRLGFAEMGVVAGHYVDEGAPVDLDDLVVVAETPAGILRAGEIFIQRRGTYEAVDVIKQDDRFCIGAGGEYLLCHFFAFPGDAAGGTGRTA